MDLNQVSIRKNNKGDSRTVGTNNIPTYEEFQESNDMHRGDVYRVMVELSRLVADAGSMHDWTKKEKEAEFYSDFCDDLKGSTKPFTDMEWFNYHINTERHHLNRRVPDDVNLIDVLELISDCTTAGLARSGYIRDVKLSDEILQKAFRNTVEMVKRALVLEQ